VKANAKNKAKRNSNALMDAAAEKGKALLQRIAEVRASSDQSQPQQKRQAEAAST
jgi:hypothetical protein